MKKDIFEYFLDGVICFDDSGTITYINPAACLLFDTSQIRIQNKKKIQDLIIIDDKNFDITLTEKNDPTIMLVDIKSPLISSIHVKISIIPKQFTESDFSIVIIKDLNHEADLHKKYQREMRVKDQKIRETNIINSVLKSIRITREPVAMIRQIAIQIMRECRCEFCFLLTKEKNTYITDFVTERENRAKVAALGIPKEVKNLQLHDSNIYCGQKNKITSELLNIINTDYYCQINLTDNQQSLVLILPVNEQLSPDQVHLLEAIRDQTSLSISSSMFEMLSNIDELTKVYNRRYFIQCAKPFFELAEFINKNCSLIILDIDHFKKINDTEGHLFGDLVLKFIGDLLKTHVRLSDIVCRYGGEEFVILLPETTQKEALLLAERIRILISNKKIEKDTHSKYITSSFGVAGKLETNSNNIEDLIHAADKALYKSKENGRNQSTEASI